MRVKNIGKLAVFLAASCAVIGCRTYGDDPAEFNPDGIWDLYYDRVEAKTTYGNGPEVTGEVSADTLGYDTSNPWLANLTVTYDSGSHEITIDEKTYPLDSFNSIALATGRIILKYDKNCQAVVDSSSGITFSDAGSRLTYWQNENYTFQSTSVVESCPAVFEDVRYSILSSNAVLIRPMNLLILASALDFDRIPELVTAHTSHIREGVRISSEVPVESLSGDEDFETPSHSLDSVEEVTRTFELLHQRAKERF